MLSEGDDAPAVSLPAYVDGERTRVDLGEYLGEGIVVLAFYPADFNPACSMQQSDLGDLDLFTMQKDVSVFGVSPDSTYSHEAFAERYGLHIPLLSDTAGEAAAAYGVAMETDIGERLAQRAVFVVDHHGAVQYARATDDLAEEIDVGPVKEAVGNIGGDDTALERYRVGYDNYTDGRDVFTAAMNKYEDREWMKARNGFEEAEPAFAAAADHFDTAVRFAETDDFETVVDRTEEKADTLQHAASWLADSADALASGRGKQGNEYRDDAQRLLDTAADLSEPPAPTAFELTDAGVELDDSIVVDPDDDDGYDWQADDGGDSGLDVDDAELDAAVDDDSDYDGQDDTPDTVEGDLEMDLDAVDEASADESDDGSDVEGDTVEGDLDMDLDAIEESADEEADSPPDGDTTVDDDTGEATADDDASDSPPGDDAADADAPSPDEASDSRPTGDEPAPAVGASTSGPEAATAEEHDDAAGGSTGDDAADGDSESSDGEAADGEEDVEELDLVDPTEMEDEEEEDDERADWDIPGR